MTLFAPGRQAELGRGGRYLCGDTEPATGITLYPDTIVRVAPAAPCGHGFICRSARTPEDAAACRAQNYATVAGLAAHAAPQDEAARLGCSHVYHRRGHRPGS